VDEGCQRELAERNAQQWQQSLARAVVELQNASLAPTPQSVATLLLQVSYVQSMVDTAEAQGDLNK
jgi:hypothetical protein